MGDMSAGSSHQTNTADVVDCWTPSIYKTGPFHGGKRCHKVVMIFLGFNFLSSLSIEAPGLFAPVGVGGNLVLHAESRLPGGGLAGLVQQGGLGGLDV